MCHPAVVSVEAVRRREDPSVADERPPAEGRAPPLAGQRRHPGKLVAGGGGAVVDAALEKEEG